jgi:hypothetical protein
MELWGNRIKSLRIERATLVTSIFGYEHVISGAQFGCYEKGEDLRFSSLLRVIKALDMTTVLVP